MSTMHAYDVRLEKGRGRMTMRFAALDKAEAEAQASHFYPDWHVVGCKRSQYAVGRSHREARRQFVAGRS